jgi:hypothetical protein
MSITLDGHVVRLEGDCAVESAEALLTLLQGDLARAVDVTRAGHLHTAVVQVLLALRPALVGQAVDPFLKTWIVPALAGQPGD